MKNIIVPMTSGQMSTASKINKLSKTLTSSYATACQETPPSFVR